MMGPVETPQLILKWATPPPTTTFQTSVSTTTKTTRPSLRKNTKLRATKDPNVKCKGKLSKISSQLVPSKMSPSMWKCP